MDLAEYMTVAEAAKTLNKSVPMISHLCRDGRLTNAVKLTTGAWLIPRESVLNYKPMKRGVKPGTQSKKAKLASGRIAFLAEAKGAKDED
jgi:excisionase family DNA binding protein